MLFFNLVLERVIRDAKLDIRGNIYKDSTNYGLCC
jgi:hypothetical protein